MLHGEVKSAVKEPPREPPLRRAGTPLNTAIAYPGSVSSRRLRGALAGFLGTYVSRYTAHDGYWLFGFLVDGPLLEVDLLENAPTDASPRGTAIRFARLRFGEQLRKGRVDPASLERAVLSIEPTATVGRSRGGSGYEGRGLRVTVTALQSGRWVARETMVFAAPHDPSREWRSAR
jgi:hypothetical protein